MRAIILIWVQIPLWLPLPVSAACHHYSKWLYPYPQRCTSIERRAENTKDKTWYVEITKMPDDWEREEAINKLKDILK